MAVDRARLGEIEALVEGRPLPVPGTPAEIISAALAVAMAYDPEVFRAYLEIMSLLSLPGEVLARTGMADRITATANSHEPLAAPGPTRRELLELVA